MAYEFFDHKERENYAIEMREAESDKIEETKHDDALKWADEEEAKEKAAALKQESEIVPEGITQEDEAWMEEQIKKESGFETSGSDIVEEF